MFLFSSLLALLGHCKRCAGGYKVFRQDRGWDCFALMYEGLYPVEVRQEDGGCSSILSSYLDMEMLYIYAVDWECLGKKGESSWIPCPRKNAYNLKYCDNKTI